MPVPNWIVPVPAVRVTVPDWDTKIKAVLAYDKIADRMVKLKGFMPDKPAVAVVPVTHIVQGGVEVEALR